MTYHYHDVEDYIDYHDMKIILHIAILYFEIHTLTVVQSSYMICNSRIGISNIIESQALTIHIHPVQVLFSQSFYDF